MFKTKLMARPQALRLLFAALLPLVLFPFGWLGRSWPDFDRALGVLFPGAPGHAVGHSIMFGLLGVLLLLTWPALRSRPAAYLGLILTAGLAQEAFQLLYKGRPLVYDDARDVLVDLVGAGLVFAAYHFISRRTNPNP